MLPILHIILKRSTAFK